MNDDYHIIIINYNTVIMLIITIMMYCWYQLYLKVSWVSATDHYSYSHGGSAFPHLLKSH